MGERVQTGSGSAKTLVRAFRLFSNADALSRTSSRLLALRRTAAGSLMDVAAIDDPRAEALRRLPATHSLALRLTDAGLSAELVAECLGIERESVGPLLTVAEAKLAALLGERQEG